MNNIKLFFSSDYLFTINSGTKYEDYYLYLSIAIILITIIIRLFLKLKGNRPTVMKKFDRIWFWGYLSLGLIGLFIWFSRTQGLPLFSTRLASYLWLSSLVALFIYLIFYFKYKVPNELSKYYEKKRKEKYFK